MFSFAFNIRRCSKTEGENEGPPLRSLRFAPVGMTGLSDSPGSSPH